MPGEEKGVGGEALALQAEGGAGGGHGDGVWRTLGFGRNPSACSRPPAPTDVAVQPPRLGSLRQPRQIHVTGQFERPIPAHKQRETTARPRGYMLAGGEYGVHARCLCSEDQHGKNECDPHN